MAPVLESKRALVTGGGSGIGLAAAKALARDGATVTIMGRTEAKLAGALDEIRAEIPGAVVDLFAGDVTDEDTVVAAVAHAGGDDGLDICVAAAGDGTVGPIVAMPLEEWNRVLGVSLNGVFLTVRESAASMMRSGRGGAIVAVSSLAGSTTHRWMGPYCAAKAGVDMLVKVAADELGPVGIRVNAVAPGIIETDLVAIVTPESRVGQSYLRESPISRFGQVDDVAPVIRFLAGPESAHMTGTILPVDGGHHLRAGPDYGEIAHMLWGDVVTEGNTPAR